jgi:hypothetical protein
MEELILQEGDYVTFTGENENCLRLFDDSYNKRGKENGKN